MVDYLALFGASLVLVACKAFQQENVLHRHWRLVPPTSYVFAFAELMVLKGGYGVVTAGAWSAMIFGCLALGTGAWLGAFGAMRIHDWRKNGNIDTTAA